MRTKESGKAYDDSILTFCLRHQLKKLFDVGVYFLSFHKLYCNFQSRQLKLVCFEGLCVLSKTSFFHCFLIEIISMEWKASANVWEWTHLKHQDIS